MPPRRPLPRWIADMHNSVMEIAAPAEAAAVTVVPTRPDVVPRDPAPDARADPRRGR